MSLKYRILIVDDEDGGRQALRILLEKCFWAYIKDMAYARDFEEAKSKLANSSFDIIFLDINLKGLSAFELLSTLPPVSTLFFVTAHSEFVLQALRNKAFDYLLKPLKEDDLRASLDRFVRDQEVNNITRTFQLRSQALNIVLPQNEIVYVEGDGPYSTIFTKEDHYKIARTIKSIINELSSDFIRIHKSFVVNRKYMKGYTLEKLILSNNQCLPVSRRGYKALASL
ncbi:MAG TPA: hypothetical protein DCQ29_07140 [Chitinophagaceae bacterium]|nr:hypothetical protein [Chitinophagaceae bacterium]